MMSVCLGLVSFSGAFCFGENNIYMNFIGFPPHPFYGMPYCPPGAYFPIQQLENEPLTFTRPQIEVPSPLPEEQQKSSHGVSSIDSSKLDKKLSELHSGSKVYRKIHWTIREDELLKKLVEVDELEWRDIPKFFEGRTQNMCYSRYRRLTIQGKQRAWSKEDEDLVIRYVDSIGEKWKQISQVLPRFTPKQIRERYLNALRDNLKKDEFTLEDDRAICNYVLAHGKHWRKMEDILPGRSEGSIKGRYYSKLCPLLEECRLDQ